MKRSTKEGTAERKRCQGAVSLEMALLMPIFLIMILGLATIGHALIVRFMLSASAYDAARTCALSRQANQACAKALVLRKMGATKKWCNNSPSVTVKISNEPGYTQVRSMEVQITCAFSGGVGIVYLKNNNITLTTLRARATMPY